WPRQGQAQVAHAACTSRGTSILVRFVHRRQRRGVWPATVRSAIAVVVLCSPACLEDLATTALVGIDDTARRVSLRLGRHTHESGSNFTLSSRSKQAVEQRRGRIVPTASVRDLHEV